MKKIFLILCICFFIVSITCVSAGENDTFNNSLQSLDSVRSDNGSELLSVNQWFVDGSKSVDGNGSIDAPFNNLKSSIDASNDCDMIYMAKGTYEGSGLNVNLTINKSLSIIGEGDVIFQGNATRIFTIGANSFNIEGLTFMGGNCSSGNGGAIYFVNGLTNSVINATFINNYALNGGALFFNNAAVNNTFMSSFINNAVSEYGGAIYIDGESKNNRWKTLFNNNSAILNGGGIFFNSTSTNNNFEGNFTNNLGQGTDGGAMFFNGESNYDVFSGNYYNNTARYYGGAIKFAAHADHNIYSGNFKNQMVTAGSAGTMRFDRGVSNSIFSGNFIDNHLVGFNTAGITIGGIAYNNTFSGTFINNTEGALFFGSPSINNVFNGTFINHTAKYVGAVSFDDSSINDTFSGTFINNYARVKNGGAITFNLGAINATFNGKFINNRAYFDGGAIAIFQAFKFIEPAYNLTFSGSFVNNTAGRNGGAIYINYADNISLADSNFESNMASNGGALYVGKNVTRVYVDNTTFNNNSAYAGGAIDFGINITDSVISNSVFDKNIATFAKAINFNDGNNVEIINSEFINSDGLGVDVNCCGKINASIINSTFEGVALIFIDKNASVSLVNNKEIDYDKGKYFVFNNGTLSLENNTLLNLIYNNRLITSKTIMAVLNNETINTTSPEVQLIADCFDDNGNYIVSDYGTFSINDSNYNVFYNGDVHLKTSYLLDEYGSYLINATMSATLSNCTYEYAIVNYNAKKNLTIKANDTEIESGKYAEIIVEFSENATGIVIATLNNESYAALVKNQTASIIISGLTSGQYLAEIEYLGDDNYNVAATVAYITVLDQISVIAPEVTKYFGGAERFGVSVFRGSVPLQNKTVNITINGITYTRLSDENGSVSIALNLNSGNYTVGVRVDNITLNSTVIILPTVNGTDIVKVFRNQTQYYATFRDSEGNYLKEGETVKFNINGVFYERTITGNEGLSKLNINLEQGTYVITVTNLITGEETSNIITVISKIVNNSDLIKYYRNDSQYIVTILKDDGSVAGAGETVTFNINGVFYERKTNESGQVKLNINLQPGDYIITAECSGCMVSNKITVLPVLTASDLTKKYGTSDAFEAKLVDGQGNPYENQKIEFNINGVFYYRTTDDGGVAKLNINLQAGEYIITSSYNGAAISNKVTVTV